MLVSPFSNRAEFTKKNDKRKIQEVDDDGRDSDVESTDSNNSKELSRERNREHARRTRMRKKIHLMNLRRLVIDLETEASTLDDARDNIFLASILVDMGNSDASDNNSPRVKNGSNFSFFVQQEKFYLQQQSPQKTEKKAPDASIIAMQASVEKLALSGADLETLKRERNRIHAKMTRNRKRELISNLEQRVFQLEETNRVRRDLICRTLRENISSNNISNVAIQLGIMN